MTSVASATTWGSPLATKHALLIHGITSSSHTWHRVASSLAAQGYLVTAPDLIGHTGRVSSDYRLGSIAEDLRPYLKARPYSLIIGHSMGGVVALHLIPYLSRSQPTAIILVDPPLRQDSEDVKFWKNDFVNSCTNVTPVEICAAKNPLWTREECIYQVLGKQLTSTEAILGIVTQNLPWLHFHWFNDVSERWKVSVLTADPAKFRLCPVEDIEPYPHIRARAVPGATHSIHSEFPEVIVEEALKRVAELDVN